MAHFNDKNTAKEGYIAVPRRAIVHSPLLIPPRPFPNDGKLQNKIVLITQAGTPSGIQLASYFAAQGAHLALFHTRQDPGLEPLLEPLLESVRNLGRFCLNLYGDWDQEGVARDLVRKTLLTFGQIHVLVNHLEWRTARPVQDNIPLTRQCLEYLKSGSSVVSMASFRPGQQVSTEQITWERNRILLFSQAIRKVQPDPCVRILGLLPEYRKVPGKTLDYLLQDQEYEEGAGESLGALLGRMASGACEAESSIGLQTFAWDIKLVQEKSLEGSNPQAVSQYSGT